VRPRKACAEVVVLKGRELSATGRVSGPRPSAGVTEPALVQAHVVELGKWGIIVRDCGQVLGVR
jgi:hypothetical protein